MWVDAYQLADLTGLKYHAVVKRLSEYLRTGKVTMVKVGRRNRYKLEDVIENNIFPEAEEQLSRFLAEHMAEDGSSVDETGIEGSVDEEGKLLIFDEGEGEEARESDVYIIKRVRLHPDVFAYYNLTRRFGKNMTLSEFINSAVIGYFKEKGVRIVVSVPVKGYGEEKEGGGGVA